MLAMVWIAFLSGSSSARAEAEIRHWWQLAQIAEGPGPLLQAQTWAGLVFTYLPYQFANASMHAPAFHACVLLA